MVVAEAECQQRLGRDSVAESRIMQEQENVTSRHVAIEPQKCVSVCVATDSEADGKFRATADLSSVTKRSRAPDDVPLNDVGMQVDMQ